MHTHTVFYGHGTKEQRLADSAINLEQSCTTFPLPRGALSRRSGHGSRGSRVSGGLGHGQGQGQGRPPHRESQTSQESQSSADLSLSWVSGFSAPAVSGNAEEEDAETGVSGSQAGRDGGLGPGGASKKLTDSEMYVRV